jgi:SNF2 family DNA or RNA helicase
MLDLIGEVLEKEGFTFARLDGTLQQSAREGVLRDFKEPGTDILLVSLRAGKNLKVKKFHIVTI